MSTCITCIYCQQTTVDVEFDREHVIPQCLGKFEPNNLVLDCVCKECNGYFGRNLDSILGRDSIEAFRRFLHGLKPLTKTHELRNNRAVLTAPAEKSERRGEFLKLCRDEHGMLTKSEFQIRVLNRRLQKYEYFRICDL